MPDQNNVPVVEAGGKRYVPVEVESVKPVVGDIVKLIQSVLSEINLEKHKDLFDSIWKAFETHGDYDGIWRAIDPVNPSAGGPGNERFKRLASGLVATLIERITSDSTFYDNFFKQLFNGPAPGGTYLLAMSGQIATDIANYDKAKLVAQEWDYDFLTGNDAGLKSKLAQNGHWELIHYSPNNYAVVRKPRP